MFSSLVWELAVRKKEERERNVDLPEIADLCVCSPQTEHELYFL